MLSELIPTCLSLSVSYAGIAVTFSQSGIGMELNAYAKMQENEPGPFWSEKLKKNMGIEGHQITPVLHVKQVAEL